MATESLKVAAPRETASDPSIGEPPPHPATAVARLAPRMASALEALLEALGYVEDLNCNLWDFAVEISAFRRLKLSNSDLRWMIGKGMIDHAIEVTLAGDSQRTFRRPSRPVFCKKTCFVLTSAGATSARELLGDAVTPRPTPSSIASPTGQNAVLGPWLTISTEPEGLVPKWDRDRQELKVGPIVVKQFKVPAANQEAILAAFEEEGWPARIDDPLSPHHEQSPKRRLQETIKSLNRNQKRPLLRFTGDGSGQGVRWEYRGPQPRATDS